MSRRVMFPDGEDVAAVVCVIPNREELSDEDREALFFSKNDYNMSRSAAKVTSREAERYGFSKVLTDTYVEKHPEVQEKLNVWVSQGHARRGLERWANRQHGEERQMDQFQVIMSVLEAQDEMLLRKNEIDWEKLRKVSHRATKISRHFARMMGKADSFALSCELRGDCCDESVSLDQRTASMSITDVDDQSISTDDISIPRVDELRDSQHSQKGSRLRRFGFGRKNRESARVSRVA